jgi:hypothetical protein
MTVGSGTASARTLFLHMGVTYLSQPVILTLLSVLLRSIRKPRAFSRTSCRYLKRFHLRRGVTAPHLNMQWHAWETEQKFNDISEVNLTEIRKLYLRAKFKALRHASMWQYRRLLERTEPIITVPGDAAWLTAAMLCGRSTLHKGIGAVKSFLRFLPKEIDLHWHDDGSLSDADKNLVRRHLPGVRIISRREADKTVQTYLERNGFSRLAALRQTDIMILKLADTAFFSRGKMLQFDSDVLCLQFPRELLDAAQSQESFKPRYNRDFGPAMTFSDSDLELFLGRPILPSFNAGLFLTKIDDLKVFYSFVERLLSAGYKSSTRPGLSVEQTLWAAWCTAQGGVALPDEYDCTFRLERGGFYPSGRVVTQHYCAFSSALFFEEFVTKVYPRLARSSHLRRVIVDSINSGVFDVAR